MSVSGGHYRYTAFKGDLRQDYVAADPPGSSGRRAERSSFLDAVLSNQRVVYCGQVPDFPRGRIFQQEKAGRAAFTNRRRHR